LIESLILSDKLILHHCRVWSNSCHPCWANKCPTQHSTIERFL